MSYCHVATFLGQNNINGTESSTKRKWSCCSAHLQDLFQNSTPHDASTEMHIFLLFLERNSVFHNWWISIKTRNNYFLYNNPKGFFLPIIAKSLLEGYWNYLNWNCSEQGLRQWVICYCWVNFLTDIKLCWEYFWESHQKYIMVDLSPRAHIAHALADSDKERLSSKQNLLQVPEETLKNWRFSINFSFLLFSYSLSLEKKNVFPTLIIQINALENFEGINCHLVATLFVVSAWTLWIKMEFFPFDFTGPWNKLNIHSS